MSKYTPKRFSPHIYPEWGVLIADLPPEKAQEIFMAICQYPHLNPDNGVWRFIKSQIDKDYNEFIEVKTWGGARAGSGRKKINQVFQDENLNNQVQSRLIKINQDENLKNLKKNEAYLTRLNPLENKEENQDELEKLEKNIKQKERKEEEKSPLNPQENNKINKNINNTLEIKISSASSLEKPTVEEVGGETMDIEELIAEKKLQEAKAKVKKFKKPTVEEVGEYCAERQNSVNPEAFVNFYESKGWVVGKSPMKDWRAAVRTWEQKRNNDPPDKGLSKEEEERKQLELINKIFGEDD